MLVINFLRILVYKQILVRTIHITYYICPSKCVIQEYYLELYDIEGARIWTSNRFCSETLNRSQYNVFEMIYLITPDSDLFQYIIQNYFLKPFALNYATDNTIKYCDIE